MVRSHCYCYNLVYICVTRRWLYDWYPASKQAGVDATAAADSEGGKGRDDGDD